MTHIIVGSFLAGAGTYAGFVELIYGTRKGAMVAWILSALCAAVVIWKLEGMI